MSLVIGLLSFAMNTQNEITEEDTQRIQAALADDEQTKFVVKPRAKLNILDHLLWLIQGTFAVGFAVTMLFSTHKGISMILLSFLCTPVFILGIICLMAPWHTRRRKLRTLYVITNKRAIILEPSRMLMIPRTIAYPLNNKLIRGSYLRNDGYGDIIFGYEASLQLNPRIHRGPAEVGFLDIPQAKQVIGILQEQIKQAPSNAHTPTIPPTQFGLPSSSDVFGNTMTMPSGETLTVFISAIFILAAIILSGTGGIFLYNDIQLRMNGIHTEAQVIHVEEDRLNNNVSYYATVRFTDNAGNQHIQRVSQSCDADTCRLGNTVPIIYRPDHIRSLCIGEVKSTTAIVLLSISAFLLLIGILIITTARRRSS